jgi:glycine betaine/proline transport system substrate-binding protein
MSPRTLTLSRIDETFYQAAAAAVALTLQRCGHEVTVRDGSHTEAYDMLGRGEADLTVAFWLPTGHAKPWAALAGKAEELITLYEGAQFFWAVPDDTAPAALRSVEDLARPDIAASFPRQIRGLSLDATITTESMQMVESYGLAALGFTVEPGEFPEWKASLTTAIEAGRNVVLPLWQPYHLNALYKLRRLKEPQNRLGGANRVVLAARIGVRESLSEATLTALGSIGLSVDAVSEMDRQICIDGLTPEEAAAGFLERRAEP